MNADERGFTPIIFELIRENSINARSSASHFFLFHFYAFHFNSEFSNDFQKFTAKLTSAERVKLRFRMICLPVEPVIL